MSNQYYFVDEETAKAREIDCVAMKGTSSLEHYQKEDFKSLVSKGFQALRLVIECKKSTKPWLFYTTRPDMLSAFYIKYLGSIPENSTQVLERSEKGLFPKDFLSSLHSYFLLKSTRLAQKYYEPFTEGKGRQIFDASLKVIKALRYDKQKLDRLITEMKPKNPLVIYYPIIVFEGNLYELKIQKKKNRISPIEYVQLDVNYVDQVYRIDVLVKSFFQKFISYLDIEIAKLKDFLDKNLIN